MNLYELTQNYNNLIELLENKDIPKEMIDNALDEVSEAFEVKAENIAKLIKNFECDIKSFKEEENRISDRRKTLENRVKNLKEYLDNAMKTTGKTKFKHGTFSFSISKNPPSLDVIDESKISPIWFIEREPVLDKRRLLENLKLGVVVDGVRIVQNESLRIR